jgi:hypothetical protein
LILLFSSGSSAVPRCFAIGIGCYSGHKNTGFKADLTTKVERNPLLLVNTRVF